MAEKILSDCGYDHERTEKVKGLFLKKELRTNADTQLLEDVVCLVFLEYYLDEFAAKHDDEKVIDILRKTMKKMSAAGIEAVNELKLPGKIRPLIEKAAKPA